MQGHKARTASSLGQPLRLPPTPSAGPVRQGPPAAPSCSFRWQYLPQREIHRVSVRTSVVTTLCPHRWPAVGSYNSQGWDLHSDAHGQDGDPAETSPTPTFERRRNNSKCLNFKGVSKDLFLFEDFDQLQWGLQRLRPDSGLDCLMCARFARQRL
jgi:hypothetical protein